MTCGSNKEIKSTLQGVSHMWPFQLLLVEIWRVYLKGFKSYPVKIPTPEQLLNCMIWKQQQQKPGRSKGCS